MYILNAFKLLPEAVERFSSLVENDMWPWMEHEPGIRPVGIWLSILAAEIRVHEMIRYNGMGQWESHARAGAEPSDIALKPVWQTAVNAEKELESMVGDKTVAALRPITARRP
jgi:hypothetical protein